MTQIMAAGDPSKATPKPRHSGSFTCGHVHFYPGLFSDVRVLERQGGTCIDKAASARCGYMQEGWWILLSHPQRGPTPLCPCSSENPESEIKAGTQSSLWLWVEVGEFFPQFLPEARAL